MKQVITVVACLSLASSVTGCAQPRTPSVTLRPGGTISIVAPSNPGLRGEYVALFVDLPKDVSDHITIQLVDKSPRAVPGTLAMALVAPNGSLLGPTNDRGITSETSGD
jgi:hypothetical protein